MQLSAIVTSILISFPLIAVGNTDAGIKKKIISKSLAGYSGSCPCPYNVTKAGKKCGKRSAYSRPGGASPVCYPSDVTEEMIKRFKSKKSD